MKHLNKDDLSYIKWRIWERLRRNPEYRKDCRHLSTNPLDLDAQEAFCKKWGLQHPVDPSVTFEQLLCPRKGETRQQATRRIQALFIDLYHPEADSAAFVQMAALDYPCLVGTYLRIYVNLAKSRNQIEAEFKKILDEWLSKDRLEFHGIGKKDAARLHARTWKSRFEVFDLAEKAIPFPQISQRIGIPIDAVYKQYKSAWEALNPGNKYPTKRKRDKSRDSDSLRTLFPCHSCPSVSTCKKVCRKANDFLKKYDEYSQEHKLVENIDQFST